MVDEEIGPDHVGDGGEHRGMAHEPIEPGEEQVGLGAELAGKLAERRALGRFEGLELPATVARLGGRQGGQGTEEAVELIGRHVRVGEGPARETHSSPMTSWAIRPPTTVASTSIDPMPSRSIAVGSAASTAKSASFPGSSEPRSASRNAAYAEWIV